MIKLDNFYIVFFCYLKLYITLYKFCINHVMLYLKEKKIEIILKFVKEKF